MQDSLIILGSCSAAFVLGQMEGIPKGFTDVSSMAIVGFVVWYTLTRINGTIEKLSESIDELKNIMSNGENKGQNP